jgi:hypothetical protein
MPLVTVNWLARHTGKDWRTISKRTAKLPRTRDRLDCATALEAIYCGLDSENGEFISTPEAVRQLTIAKKSEIDLEMEIKRGDRIPIADCLAVDNEVFQAIAGTIKANRGKRLDEDVTNEIFDNLRDWAGRLNGNGKHD